MFFLKTGSVSNSKWRNTFDMKGKCNFTWEYAPSVHKGRGGILGLCKGIIPMRISYDMITGKSKCEATFSTWECGSLWIILGIFPIARSDMYGCNKADLIDEFREFIKYAKTKAKKLIVIVKWNVTFEVTSISDDSELDNNYRWQRTMIHYTVKKCGLDDLQFTRMPLGPIETDYINSQNKELNKGKKMIYVYGFNSGHCLSMYKTCKLANSMTNALQITFKNVGNMFSKYVHAKDEPI